MRTSSKPATCVTKERLACSVTSIINKGNGEKLGDTDLSAKLDVTQSAHSLSLTHFHSSNGFAKRGMPQSSDVQSKPMFSVANHKTKQW